MVTEAEIRGRLERLERLAEEVELLEARELADQHLAGQRRAPRPVGDADAGRGHAVPVPEPGVPLIVLSALARAEYEN
jgi:hypothetical protein